MQLQRRTSDGAWHRVVSARQSASGVVTLPLKGLPHAALTYRLRMSPWKGAPAAGSPWRTFAPAPYEPTSFDLPVLRIDTTDHAVITKEAAVDAVMSIDGGPAQPLTIKGRGNSTWTFPKKPYKLKLATKASLLGMPTERDWVLLANFGDRSLLRNTAALDLGAQTGLAWTPRHRAVEVVLDGSYVGSYLLTEHVERSDDRVDKTSRLFELDERLEADEAADGVDLGFRSRRGTPVVYQDPDTPTDEEKSAASAAVEAFETALATHDYATWSPLVDVDSFVDFYLVSELFKGIDADCFTSCFFTWKPGGTITMGPLWDFDHSAGYGPGKALSPYLSGPTGWWANRQDDFTSVSRPHPSFSWLAQMWRSPQFRTAVIARWDELSDQIAAVPSGLPGLAAALGNASSNNWERWSGAQYQVAQTHGTTWAGEVAWLQTWLTQRIAWLDTHLADPPKP